MIDVEIKYKSQYANIFLSLFYAILITQIPWDILKGVGFTDLQNYINRFNELASFGDSYINISGTFLGFFVSEGLWSYLLLGFARLDFDAGFSLSIISFLCSFTVCAYVLSKSKWYFSIFLLVNPLLVDLFLSQQRSALAFSLFLIALMNRRISIFIVIFCIAIFIHTASILLFSLYFISNFLVKKIKVTSLKSINMRSLIVFTLFALTVAIGKDIVLTFINDRRGGGIGESVSLAYASFWFFALAVVVILCKTKNLIAVQICISLLVLFCISTLFGQYSARYLSFGYPFLIVCVSHLKGAYSPIFFMLIIFYQFIQWIYWWAFFIN